jgi:hypothetical protein
MSMNLFFTCSLNARLPNLFGVMWNKLLELHQDMGLSPNFFGVFPNLFLPAAISRLQGLEQSVGQSRSSEIKLALRTS